MALWLSARGPFSGALASSLCNGKSWWPWAMRSMSFMEKLKQQNLLGVAPKPMAVQGARVIQQARPSPQDNVAKPDRNASDKSDKSSTTNKKPPKDKKKENKDSKGKKLEGKDARKAQLKMKKQKKITRNYSKFEQNLPPPDPNMKPPGPKQLYFAEQQVKQPEGGGYVQSIAIIGAPNAGKSTLTNLLVGNKVSIVSKKAQTTRENTVGVLTKDNKQLHIFDTPGVLSTRSQRERYRARITASLMSAAWEAVNKTAIVVMLVDGTKLLDSDTKFIISHLSRVTKQQGNKGKLELVLAINKTDKVPDENVDVLLNALKVEGLDTLFSKVFPISAITGKNVDKLKEYLFSRAEPGDWLFPAQTKTPQSIVQQVAEVVREKLFQRYNKEIPYRIEQCTVGWTVQPDGVLRIDQQLVLPTARYKPILIGSGGKGIKFLAMATAQDLKKILDREVRVIFHMVVQKQTQQQQEGTEKFSVTLGGDEANNENEMDGDEADEHGMEETETMKHKL